jgi:hypothetical protein
MKLEALAVVPVSSDEFDPFGAPGDVFAVCVPAALDELAGSPDGPDGRREGGTLIKPEEEVEWLE